MSLLQDACDALLAIADRNVPVGDDIKRLVRLKKAVLHGVISPAEADACVRREFHVSERLQRLWDWVDVAYVERLLGTTL